jgi:8-oxo-dGTP pyrophosphatase MutT (NUDIX family)
VRFRLLHPGDPELTPSQDPRRSRARIDEAILEDAAAREARKRVRALLDRHGPALADRSMAPAHLTGSALVVDPQGPRMLVLLHAKLSRWLQPGGHADGDHELAGVALREAVEESGIADLAVLVPAVDLDIHTVDHGDELGEHQHLDLRFVVVSPPGAVAVGNHESLAQRWVRPGELDDLCGDAGLVRLARVGLAALDSVEPGRLPGGTSAHVAGRGAALHAVHLGEAVDGP